MSNPEESIKFDQIEQKILSSTSGNICLPPGLCNDHFSSKLVEPVPEFFSF